MEKRNIVDLQVKETILSVVKMNIFVLGWEWWRKKKQVCGLQSEKNYGYQLNQRVFHKLFEIIVVTDELSILKIYMGSYKEYIVQRVLADDY